MVASQELHEIHIRLRAAYVLKQYYVDQWKRNFHASHNVPLHEMNREASEAWSNLSASADNLDNLGLRFDALRNEEHQAEHGRPWDREPI